MESLLTFPISESRLFVFVSFSGTRATSGVAVQVLDHFPETLSQNINARLLPLVFRSLSESHFFAF
jgi:hypothetical protein